MTGSSIARVAILAALVSCQLPTAPDTPPINVREITAPHGAAEWWGDMEVCTMAHRDMRDIRWFVADSLYDSHGVPAAGLFVAPTRIYIRADFARDEFMLKHEIVHALIGDGEHRRTHIWNTCPANPLLIPRQ